MRPRVWDDERIEPWYAQNTVLYAARRPEGQRRDLDARPGVTSGAPLALIHPRLFAERDDALAQSRQACATATAELQEAHTALATAREQHRAEAERLDREIRPTPEPATYGALFLSGCVGLLGWRRFRQRRR